ncbi:TPA: hypothetical protein U1079_001124 [Streptococcus suis]|nr:hypothetical protein [Streptococcus suis]
MLEGGELLLTDKKEIVKEVVWKHAAKGDVEACIGQLVGLIRTWVMEFSIGELDSMLKSLANEWEKGQNQGECQGVYWDTMIEKFQNAFEMPEAEPMKIEDEEKFNRIMEDTLRSLYG